uniref:Secreted protein n=1 Tax=Arion vulgaris TaxID=1028688 RepID=A0A0B7AKE2_9EUPU
MNAHRALLSLLLMSDPAAPSRLIKLPTYVKAFVFGRILSSSLTGAGHFQSQYFCFLQNDFSTQPSGNCKYHKENNSNCIPK